jgi:uncharacterized protein
MLLHVTLVYAGILGLLLVVLSFNVMQNWVRVTGQGKETDLGMRRAERILSSFVEYAPLTLMMIAFGELSGAPPGVLHIMGGTLVAARIMHAYGSNDMPFAGLLRFLGAQLTFLTLTVASIVCIYYFQFGRV